MFHVFIRIKFLLILLHYPELFIGWIISDFLDFLTPIAETSKTMSRYVSAQNMNTQMSILV